MGDGRAVEGRAPLAPPDAPIVLAHMSTSPQRPPFRKVEIELAVQHRPALPEAKSAWPEIQQSTMHLAFRSIMCTRSICYFGMADSRKRRPETRKDPARPGPLRRVPQAASGYLPAALSTARTRPGVIGASRMRTPVASKNAFATAAGTGDSAGSPEPVVREPGPGRVGHVGAGEPVDVDLRRVLEPDHRVGDPVEARHALLVEHDLLVRARGRGPASRRPPRCSRCRPGRRSGRRRPRRAACLATILPVFLFTSMSATQHVIVFE